jgi:hypothetical protein
MGTMITVVVTAAAMTTTATTLAAENTSHAPGRLFEGVACPSASGRDLTPVQNQNLQLRNQ